MNIGRHIENQNDYDPQARRRAVGTGREEGRSRVAGPDPGRRPIRSRCGRGVAATSPGLHGSRPATGLSAYRNRDRYLQPSDLDRSDLTLRLIALRLPPATYNVHSPTPIRPPKAAARLGEVDVRYRPFCRNRRKDQVAGAGDSVDRAHLDPVGDRDAVPAKCRGWVPQQVGAELGIGLGTGDQALDGWVIAGMRGG